MNIKSFFNRRGSISRTRTVVPPSPRVLIQCGCRESLTEPGSASGFESPSREFLPDLDQARFRLENLLEEGTSRAEDPLSTPEVIEERNRLAREIHDTLVQEFAGILLHLEAVSALERNAPQQVSEYLARAKQLARAGLEDSRRMLLNLRPKSLDGFSLPEALDQLAERFSRDCGIVCSFNLGGPAWELPERIQDELYRVAQEALCNVQKHSRASSACISLSFNSSAIVLSIEDDGQGFALRHHQAGASGFGLPAMCDRAHQVGGMLDINTGQGRGTEVKVVVPLPDNTPMERSNE